MRRFIMRWIEIRLCCCKETAEKTLLGWMEFMTDTWDVGWQEDCEIRKCLAGKLIEVDWECSENLWSRSIIFQNILHHSSSSLRQILWKKAKKSFNRNHKNALRHAIKLFLLTFLFHTRDEMILMQIPLLHDED